MILLLLLILWVILHMVIFREKERSQILLHFGESAQGE